ncbi:MAG: hypothetical protein ABFD98_19770 [Syntrophobacteraceae bacterium]|nr:hypothetical protein [Desulfobacteraceae bacterium]
MAAGAAASGSQASQPPKTQVQQKMERSFSKKESAKALDSFKRDQSRYKQDPGAKSYTPASATERSTVDSIRKRVTYTENSTYYTRRNVFYTSYGWSAPGYAFGSYSSFGIWDAMMLWFMLDHLNDHRYASMYYHHRDDPGMQQFRKEAERLSLENADLREKLKDLDTRTKAMEAQGMKPDPSYVPDDAANVALASSVVEKEMSHGAFPWGWTVAGALAVVLAVMMMRRRKV